jgi:hypothetical protein
LQQGTGDFRFLKSSEGLEGDACDVTQEECLAVKGGQKGEQ